MPRAGPAAVSVPASGFFHGEQLYLAETGGFRVRETAYLNGMRTPWHRHRFPYFAYTLQGSSLQTYPSGILQCCPGTLVFHSSNEVHRDRFLAPNVHVLQFEIEPSRSEGFDRPLCRLATCKNLALPTVHYLASRIHSELMRLDELSGLVIEGLALELIALVLRSNIQAPEWPPANWLCRAEELIRTRFTESFGLSAIAREIGVCPVHLAREFRKHYGCTVGERIRELRLEYASSLIVHTRRPLAEIALAAGFADQSHFSRTFRSYTGMTPSQFSTSFRQVKTVQAS